MAVINIESSCNSIIQRIRSSGLNFSCQETPFSLYMTVRKSWAKKFSSTLDADQIARPVEPVSGLEMYLGSSAVSVKYDELHVKYDKLLAKCEKLQVEKKNVEETLKEVIEESDSRGETISELGDQNLIQCEQIQALMLKVTKAEKKVTDMEKYKDISNEEIKQFKDEISDLKNATSKANKEVKNLKRENAHLEHENKKKCEAYEFQIDKLKGLYSEKIANEKDVKTREKKLKKKIRELEEEKCQFTIDKRKFKQEQNNNSAIFTNSLKMVDNAAIPTQVQTEPIIECLETHSLKTTDMDSTLMETNLMLTTNISATTSLELTKSEPNICELSSQDPAIKHLKDLIKEMEKKTEDLGRKMDEADLKCLDIKNILRK